jgi:hypothetical protein
MKILPVYDRYQTNQVLVLTCRSQRLFTFRPQFTMSFDFRLKVLPIMVIGSKQTTDQ